MHKLLLAGLVLMTGLAVVAACGSKSNQDDPCVVALNRLQRDCPGVMVSFGDGGTDNLNCTESAACAADCLTNGDCDEIKKNSGAFKMCLDACGAQ